MVFSQVIIYQIKPSRAVKDEIFDPTTHCTPWNCVQEQNFHYSNIRAKENVVDQWSVEWFNLHVAWSIPLEPRSTYSGRQLLVGYWGQNGAGPANGPANYEKPLFDVCQTTKYDILAVSFVIVFFDARNKGIYLIWCLSFRCVKIYCNIYVWDDFSPL